MSLIVFISLGFQALSQTIDDFKVGDLLYSILPPTEFYKQHGEKNWRLLSSMEDIKGSALEKKQDSLSRGKLPDGRGMFLRAMNMGRNDGHGDPDSLIRTVGSLQSDMFKQHRHFSRGSEGINDHKHNNAPADAGWSQNDVAGQNVEYETDHPSNVTPNRQPPGGVETRPKNIALYLYIKINNNY